MCGYIDKYVLMLHMVHSTYTVCTKFIVIIIKFSGESGDVINISIIVFVIVLIILYCCLVFLFCYCCKRKARHYKDKGTYIKHP